MTTKILALVDALGNLVRFTLMPGQRGEITGAKELIEDLPIKALLADKAYDADHFRDTLKSKDIQAVIPARQGRIDPAEHDEEMYKWRHLIENFFQKLKEFKRIAMRSCKTDTSFSAMINITAVIIRTR